MSGMRWYIARRLMWAIFATWVALSITWGLLALSPNQGELRAAQQAAMQGGDAEEAMEDFRTREGLNRHWTERYMDYVVGMMTLNWGWSDQFSKPVLDLFIEKYPFSLQYALPVTIITVIVGYGLGLYSAMNQYTREDYAATLFAFFGLSIPNFWFAIILILIMGVWMQDAAISLFAVTIDLSWFQLPTFYNPQVVREHGWVSLENIRQLILPIAVLSTAAFASNMRYSRAQALEYANSEFVKTAKSKGASGWRVLTRHILRVALVPLATILVFDILNLLFAGTLIIEFIFQIPGLGWITYQGFINQDTAIIMANTLIGVFIAIVGYLLQDLAYVALDPRIEYGDR